MIVAIMSIDLYLPGAASLKEKRSVLRRIKDQIRHKFNVSIAEVDFQDKWQRAGLGLAQVSSDYKYLEKNMQKIFRIIDNDNEAEIIEHTIEYL